MQSRPNKHNSNTPAESGRSIRPFAQTRSKIDIIQANIQYSTTGFAALIRASEEETNIIVLVQAGALNR